MLRVEQDQPGHPQVRALRISVVEDDAVVREQLVDQLDHIPGFKCVSNHRTGEEALESLPKYDPEVVLMDINLPRMSGIDCVRNLKGFLPKTQFIMLTVYEDADVIFRSLLAGAVGYLLKGQTGFGAQVVEAVRDAARGGSPLNSLIARKIVQHFHHQLVHTGPKQHLTAREREVLELLSKGLPYKEIADMLNLNIETIRKHCHNIYEKLQVNSRTEALVKYYGK
jgi:DNA-binding NarL/FixJ family response regulator